MYDTVLKKFDDFFKVQKNIIYECACFNRRNKRQGETSEQYITVLYELAKNCEYGMMKDKMIRDQLVVRIRDNILSQKLEMDALLNFGSLAEGGRTQTPPDSKRSQQHEP